MAHRLDPKPTSEMSSDELLRLAMWSWRRAREWRHRAQYERKSQRDGLLDLYYDDMACFRRYANACYRERAAERAVAL